jgi:hypothetical protein
MASGPIGIAEPEETPVTSKKKKIICEFCESELAISGDVLKLSETAKKMRDDHDEVVALTEEVTRLNTKIAAFETSPSSSAAQPTVPAPERSRTKFYAKGVA